MLSSAIDNPLFLGYLFGHSSPVAVNGTVMQIEKALINDRLRVSKVSRKCRIPTIYNFAVSYPGDFLFS